MRRLLCAVATVTLTLAACSSSSKKASNTTAPVTQATTTTTIARPASYGFGTREETFVDTSRSTPPNKTYKGAPTRTIRVRYFYPTEQNAPAHNGAPFPIVVFSHGWTASPEVYHLLEEAIARAGYVVVAPAYPLSNTLAPGGPVVTDLGNQPKDASFVLDRVLEHANDPASWLHGFVDPARIGAAGHSLGGFTTYGFTYNATCGDSRIKAAVPMSAIAAGCPGAYFAGPPIPLLAIHGDHDELVPYRTGHTSWEKAKSPKFFMTIIGGKHATEALGGTTPKQQALTKATIDFFDLYLKGDQSAMARLQQVASQPGIAKLESQP
jgi:dienelactone hydrolase